MKAKPFPDLPRRPHPWLGPPSKGTFFPPRPSVTPIPPPPAGGKSPLLRRRAAPWDRPIPSISLHSSTPIAAAAYEGEGGTGGKAPRRPLRRPRAKPYDPPPGRTLFPSTVEKNNWLTEFVYSASRAIARSCSLLFSSISTMMNAVLEENHQLVAQTPPPGGKCPLLRRRAAPWDRPIPSISPHPLTPIAAAAFEGEGGTGGKAPKRPLRRPRLKPYDPPPGRALFTSAVEKNNWLTEFVYSASRTIARSCKKSSEENHQLAEFNQGGDVGAKHANPISEIEHLLSKKTFTRAQSILIIELLRSKTPELSILEAVPFEERQESGKQSIRSDSTISVSAVKPMMRKRKMSSLDDDFESSEPQRKIPRWTISECTTVPLIEKPAFQTTISEELNMDDEEPAFRMAIPEDFLEIDDDEDNSCDIGPIATTLPVLEKPSFHMTAPEDLSESDNDECDLNDIEFAFHVSHAPQTEQFEFGSEQCWHPAFKQCTSL